jgi:hypothetical protein
MYLYQTQVYWVFGIYIIEQLRWLIQSLIRLKQDL